MGIGDIAAEEGTGFLVALVKRNVGYCLFLGIVAAIIATAATQLFIGGLGSFSRFGHPWVLIPEFFVIWSAISIAAFLSTMRDDELKRREKDVVDREAKLAERDTTFARREAELAKRETEDLLTPFRRSLEGAWEIEFCRWTYDDKGAPRSEVEIDLARFCVNEDTGKLAIHIPVRDGHGYRRDELNIDAISIRPIKAPQTFDYYHRMRLVTKDGTIIEGETFVHLDIVFDNDKVSRLDGTWYDLQGKFAAARRQCQRGVNPTSDLPTFGNVKFTPYVLEAPAAVRTPATVATS